MKILVIGAGSIGARHCGNAAMLADSAGLFDIDREKSVLAAENSGIKPFDTLQEALAWAPQGVVVATPHKTHINLARQALEAGADVLIEKPISHAEEGVDNLLSFAAARNRQVFVVCNMRYHPAVKILYDHLPAIGDIYYARAQYGNYLPHMRPDADYKKLYCAHREQGGGVILDAIHEIDYLSWLFGGVDTVSCEADRRSDLDIDVEDYAALVLKHETGIRSEIHLDYLQQFKQRGCEIAGSKGTLIWSSAGKNPEYCTVKFYDKDGGSWRTLLENKNLDSGPLYRELMKAFIAALRRPGSRPELLDGVSALVGLRVALAAHESAQTGKRIRVSHDIATDKKKQQQRAAL